MPEQSNLEVRHSQWKHVVRRWAPAFCLCLAIVGIGALCVALSHQSTLVVQGMALQGAELQIRSVSEFRQMYSSEVAAKARLNGLEVTHDYKDKPGAIPLPATLTKALGEEITHKRPGAHIRLYSDFPYPWRDPIDRDDVFSAEALRALRHNPDHPFYRFEPFEGRPSLRYAIADRMSQSCVDCHNNHPDSPKRDWKAGDVRGALEFIRPLDNEGPIAVLSARGTIQVYLMIAFGMVGLGLLGLLWSIRTLRQSGANANAAHRTARDALRETEALRNTLDEHAIVLVTDTKGSIIHVNDLFCRISGYSREELLGSNPRIINSGHHPKAVWEEMWMALAAGRTVRGERCNKAKDGRLYWVEVTITPWKNQDGTIEKYVSFQTDITERKQLEQSSRDSEQFLRSAIDSLDSHTVVLGSDAQILSVNRAWREFALANNGTGSSLLEGANYLDPCDKAASSCPETAQVATAVRSVLAGEAEPSPIEYACHAPTGQQWFLCSIRGFSRNERRFAVVSHLNITAMKVAESRLLAEVTEREQLQSQLVQAQKLESIGQLAAGIAHEINTPTQFISDNVRFLRDSQLSLLGLVDMVVNQLDDSAPARSWSDRSEEIRRSLKELDFEFVREEVPKAIEQSLEGLERVATLVRAMKDFSHPGSENKTPADINKAIESTVTVCRNRWKYAADLEMKLEQDLPLVLCRVAEMNQVFLNLIVNASDAIMEKHGEGTKGLIRVSTCASEDSVEVRVQDNGGGIPESLRNRIFDPFFTTKEVGKGTGQGLAISRDVVVNKHGGSLDVESTSGVGTTFVIRLPIHDSANVPKGAEAEAAV